MRWRPRYIYTRYVNARVYSACGCTVATVQLPGVWCPSAARVEGRVPRHGERSDVNAHTRAVCT